MDPAKRMPPTGWSMDRILSELTAVIEQEKKIFIIVLDEIDRSIQKNGDDIFYYLTTMNEILKESKVSIVGITNNAKFTEFLDPKIRSRLGEERIVFPPYNVEQLKDILYDRARDAFDENMLDDDVIPYCAAMSAQEMGDARKALDLLRMSADLAERNGDSKVTSAHVKLARDKIELDAMNEVVKTLTVQSKTVLLSIIINKDNGMDFMTTGDVYSTYKLVCETMGLSVLTQRRVGGLISELDMLGIVHARVKSFGRAGRTKEIELNIPQKICDNVKDDEIFMDYKKKNHKQTTLM
jgi:cell division control protein 6